MHSLYRVDRRLTNCRTSTMNIFRVLHVTTDLVKATSCFV